MNPAMSELERIVDEYISRHQERAARELRWFKIQRTFEQAVSLATRAEGPNRKRLSHQRRITKSALVESQQRLLGSLSVLRQAQSFEELHELVALLIRTIPGIGDLTIYDTSLRIGAKLNLSPEHIFLHAGTRKGAKQLGLNMSREYLTLDEVPEQLRRLLPREIEDFLCIYKDQLGISACHGLGCRRVSHSVKQLPV